jgi:hypothetical protein
MVRALMGIEVSVDLEVEMGGPGGRGKIHANGECEILA